jgi:hypothetical protein
VFEFAVMRVWAMRHQRPGPPIWVLFRRSLEEDAEVKYYVFNADPYTRWHGITFVLTRVAVARSRAGRFQPAPR